MNTAERIESIRELQIQASEAIEDYMDKWIWNSDHDTVTDLGEGSHWYGLVGITVDQWFGPGEYVIGTKSGETIQSTTFRCREPENLAESMYLALAALHKVTGDEVDADRDIESVNGFLING